MSKRDITIGKRDGLDGVNNPERAGDPDYQKGRKQAEQLQRRTTDLITGTYK